MLPGLLRKYAELVAVADQNGKGVAGTALDQSARVAQRQGSWPRPGTRRTRVPIWSAPYAVGWPPAKRRSAVRCAARCKRNSSQFPRESLLHRRCGQAEAAHGPPPGRGPG